MHRSLTGNNTIKRNCSLRGRNFATSALVGDTGRRLHGPPHLRNYTARCRVISTAFYCQDPWQWRENIRGGARFREKSQVVGICRFLRYGFCLIEFGAMIQRVVFFGVVLESSAMVSVVKLSLRLRMHLNVKTVDEDSRSSSFWVCRWCFRLLFLMYCSL